MAIRVGNKAEGDAFFDRVTEREDIWRHLEGNHIVLSGPRRLGKTSLLQRIAEEAAEKGILARLIDVEGIDNAEAFIDQLSRAFPEESIKGYMQEIGARVTSWFERIRKMEVKLPGGIGAGIEVQAIASTSWSSAAMHLQQRVAPAPLLILVDEFSVFLEKLLVKDKFEAVQLLGWLRAWRMTSGVACRFVFSGSIGFNTLLERYRLGTYFNDCYDFRLQPFRPAAALAMLEEEARREGWQVETTSLQHLCARIGWLSPFYLNLLLDSSLEAGRDRELEEGNDERRLLQSDVDDAYDRLLATRSRFVHWYQRLEREIEEPELSFALAVLAAIAKAENGLTRSQVLARLHRREPDADVRGKRFDRIMLKLEEDGYLGMDGDRILFLSFLLRDYWRRNHV